MQKNKKVKRLEQIERSFPSKP